MCHPERAKRVEPQRGIERVPRRWDLSKGNRIPSAQDLRRELPLYNSKRDGGCHPFSVMRKEALQHFCEAVLEVEEPAGLGRVDVEVGRALGIEDRKNSISAELFFKSVKYS